jgi:hypothetical protein
MKKIILVGSLVISLQGFAQNQLPNSGFESWETVPYKTTSYTTPLNWLGEACVSVGIGTESKAECKNAIEKSTDAATGNFAMKVTTGALGLALMSDMPFEGSPTALNVKMKASIPADAKATISVYFHRDSLFSNDSQDVASGTVSITSSISSYESTSIAIAPSLKNVSYKFVSVIVSVSDDTDMAYILVDDLSFSYDPAGLLDSDERSKLVYPTLVETDLFVDANIQNIEILDLNGIVVKESSEHQISLENIRSGIYVLRAYKTDNKVFTTKIIKK